MREASKRTYSLEKLGAIYGKTEGRCAYCGRIFGPFDDWIVEHVISRSRGGSNEIDNLVLSCQSCNQQKRDRSLEGFRLYIKESPIMLLEKIIARLERTSACFKFFPSEIIDALQEALRAIDRLEVEFYIEKRKQDEHISYDLSLETKHTQG